MILRHNIFLILLISQTLCFGQQRLVESYLLKSRNFNINFQDTLIEASIFTLPTGEFHFTYGHDILKLGYKSFRFIKDGRNTKSVIDSIVKSQKPDLFIDSYFPMLHQDSSKVLDYGVLWHPHHYHEFEDCCNFLIELSDLKFNKKDIY